MASVEIDLDNNAMSPRIRPDEWGPSVRSYRCHIQLEKEEDGTYSAIALNLPGAGSCGDSADEAIANACEAIIGAIQSYLEAGDEIPWEDSLAADIPDSVEHKWILVHV